MSEILSALAQSARRHDPDRFFCALFAPPDRRETLWLLVAFNHELARAREVAREPLLARIRLQWWREVVGGARRRHEVAGPLGEALDDGRLEARDLMAMIDAREIEAEPQIETFAAWRDYVRATAGGWAVAAGQALGGQNAALDKLRDLGAVYGVAGQLRNIHVLARRGLCRLPADLLASCGLSPEHVLARPDDPALRPVLKTLADWGRAIPRAKVPRALRAAALPAVLGRRDLRSLRFDHAHGGADRLAVAWAALGFSAL